MDWILKMKRKIIFYAPLGKDTPPDRIGGAEAGCLKTKAIYERAGIKVVVINKPALSKGKNRFLVEMALTPLKLLWVARREGSITPIHIVGFYTKIVKYEWLLMKIAHLCGNKVVYELRNGSMVSTYLSGTKEYRKYLRDLLLKPEVVLCQGQEYVDFIYKGWGVKRDYYPNYIMDEFMSPNNIDRPHPIRLVYFGRVTESKNVDVTINVLRILRENGLDAKLDIIGGCSELYREKLDDIINNHDLNEIVSIHGRKPFDFIAKTLRQSHYFVFPSSEVLEGHSNSLTEAMGCGVVPIVSNAGFNTSICGYNELVVDGISPQDYADIIIKIENNNEWSYYSNCVYQRVKDNYTEKIVGEKLISAINQLYE